MPFKKLGKKAAKEAEEVAAAPALAEPAASEVEPAKVEEVPLQVEEAVAEAEGAPPKTEEASEEAAPEAGATIEEDDEEAPDLQDATAPAAEGAQAEEPTEPAPPPSTDPALPAPAKDEPAPCEAQKPVEEKNDMPRAASGDTSAGSSIIGGAMSPSPSTGASDAESATATVRAVCDLTKPGDRVVLVGATADLGQWDPARGAAMTTTAETWPTWSADVSALTAGTEYKLVVVRDDGYVDWEPIQGNRVYQASQGPAALVFGMAS